MTELSEVMWLRCKLRKLWYLPNFLTKFEIVACQLLVVADVALVVLREVAWRREWPSLGNSIPSWKLWGAGSVDDGAIRSNVVGIKSEKSEKTVKPTSSTSRVKNVWKCNYACRFCTTRADAVAIGRQISQVDMSVVSNREVTVLKELTNLRVVECWLEPSDVA